jgi:ferredoxin
MNSSPPMPRVDQALCTRCGACVDACPCHAIEMTDEGPVFHCGEACALGHDCSHHGGDCWCVCQEACPEDAIECPFEIVFEEGDEPKP